MCTVTSFRIKSLRIINYIYYKVLTSREEYPDKQLSHPYLFSFDENKLKHPSCHCCSDHQADEGAFKGCFTICLLLIMCLIMALPHTQESLHFLLIYLPRPPDSSFCIMSCSWLPSPFSLEISSSPKGLLSSLTVCTHAHLQSRSFTWEKTSISDQVCFA